MEIREVAYDHPDVVALVERVQEYYTRLYGGADDTRVEPAEFAPPRGRFFVGYDGDRPVACGGWRARDDPAPGLRPGDAEMKRLYVVEDHRGRGSARALVARLERSAAADGRLRMVLETGAAQREAVALYESRGYRPTTGFGLYRHEPASRYFLKSLADTVRITGRTHSPGTSGSNPGAG